MRTPSFLAGALALTLIAGPPLLISSAASADPVAFTAAITNGPIYPGSTVEFGGDKLTGTTLGDITVSVSDGEAVTVTGCSGTGVEDTQWSCTFDFGSDMPVNADNYIELSVVDADEVSTPQSLRFDVIADPVPDPIPGAAGLPAVTYSFSPQSVIVHGAPTDLGTVVAIHLLVPGADQSSGCPNSDSDNVFESEALGINDCGFTGLKPGQYGVQVQQDVGDGQTAADSSMFDSFNVPEKPAVVSTVVRPDNSVVITGTADLLAFDVENDRSDAGQRIVVTDHVGPVGPNVPNGPTVPTGPIGPDQVEGFACEALPADTTAGEWSCATVPLPAGVHIFTAYLQDTGAGSVFYRNDARYIDGGVSAGADSPPTTVVALPVVPVVPVDPSPPTPPPGPSPAPPPGLTTPQWSFDLTGINSASLHPGDRFVARGTGLPPGSILSMEIHSTPVLLGSTTVLGTGEFSLEGVVPLDIAVGQHEIVLSLTGDGLAPTTVARQVTVVTAADTSLAVTNQKPQAVSGEAVPAEGAPTEGAADHTDTAPNILTHGLVQIGDVLAHPQKIGAAIAIGLVLLIFAVLPAHLLNATIGEQYERFARRMPVLRQQPKWLPALRDWLTRFPVLGAALVTTVTAFLFGFADPKFGFTLASLRLFLATAIALFVVVFLANAIAGSIMRRRFSVDVELSIRPLGLILTLVGVIVSRAMEFSPGFLIGLVLGLTIASRSATAHAWQAVLIRSSIVLGLALFAWLGFSAFTAREGEIENFTSALFLEILVAITVEGMVVLMVELLPLRLLEGERLFARSKVIWGLAYVAVVAVFIVAVIPWEGNWEALGGSLWSWITVVVGFGAVCTAIYLYFRFLAAPLHPQHDGEQNELVSISDND